MQKGLPCFRRLFVPTNNPKPDKPPMQTTPKLTDTQTLHTARCLLEKHLPLQAHGYTCQSTHLYEALLAVCASGETLEAVCQDLPGAPEAGTVRPYLNEQLTLEALPELERRLNEALCAELPRRLRRKPQQIALDFHDRPYYGKAAQEEAPWVRGRAKDGTTRFFRVATAYVIDKGMRLTLSLRFVLPEDSTVAVLKTLLDRLTAREVPIACLLLDKGFAGIQAMAYLDEAGLPAIIACPIRGKKAPEPGGTRALCQGRKSYTTAYTFRNSPHSFTARLAVCRVFTTARRTGRMKRRAAWLVFIVLGKALEGLSPRQVRRLYRRRFGVETSYRLAARVRAWTSSRNAAYRFLLLGLSFVMVNVWVHLCWLYTQVPRRGGRSLETERFRLRRFAKFIWQALERKYGYVRAITAPAVPLL